MAKDQNTAILPSSTMELAEGSILMDGIVEFRTDPKTKLVKAVSSTEWMHRGRALKKGRQVRYGVCACAHTHISGCTSVIVCGA